MKIYNVRNGKRFFEKLAGCEGKVELIDGSGNRLFLTEGGQQKNLIPMTYFDGEIRELELNFHEPGDCEMIFSYLVNS